MFGTNNQNDISRCLWVAKMPSPNITKLPSSNPNPRLLDFNFVKNNEKQFERSCQNIPGRYFVTSASIIDKKIDTHKEYPNFHRGLLLYTSPRQFKLSEFSEYLNNKHIPEHAKRIAQTLHDLWPKETSVVFRQLVQWYASLRGMLSNLTILGHPSLIFRDTEWCGQKQADWLLDDDYSINKNESLFSLKMPKDLPLAFRKMIQDAWISLQQLEHSCLKRGQWRIACQHLASVYQQVAIKETSISNKKIITPKPRAANQIIRESRYTPNSSDSFIEPKSTLMPRITEKKPISLYRQISLLA